MERRFIIFLTLSFAILWGYMALMAKLYPPAARPPKGAVAAAKPDAAKENAKPGPQPEQPPAETPAQAKPDAALAAKPNEEPAGVAAAPAEALPAAPRQWLTLGSADPSDPYRMLVTLDNKGASVARIELSSPRYRDLEDRSGYIGHLVMDAKQIDRAVKEEGCLVQVVGPGTPAAKAGLKPGDLIVAVGGKPIDGVDSFHRVMSKTTPKRPITLKVKRGGKELSLTVTPGWRPLEVIRPEAGSPPSFLLTLQQLDDRELLRKEDEEVVAVGEEMKGMDLWSSNWTVVSTDAGQVAFRQVLPGSGVEITKTYRLDRVPDDSDRQPRL